MAIVSSAELLLDALQSYKSEFESTGKDDAISKICAEVRKCFRGTLSEHIQTNLLIYRNMQDAESILELVEVVVTEYGDVLITDDAACKLLRGKEQSEQIPIVKKARIELEDEPWLTVKYLFFCSLNMTTEPLISATVTTKGRSICEKCLVFLEDKKSRLFVLIVDEFLNLLNEIFNVYSLFFLEPGSFFVENTIKLRSFDCSKLFSNCILEIQFQKCFDNLVDFSFSILNKVIVSFIRSQPSKNRLVVQLILKALHNSSYKTKNSILNILENLVTNSSCSIDLHTQSKPLGSGMSLSLLAFFVELCQDKDFHSDHHYSSIKSKIVAVINHISKNEDLSLFHLSTLRSTMRTLFIDNIDGLHRILISFGPPFLSLLTHTIDTTTKKPGSELSSDSYQLTSSEFLFCLGKFCASCKESDEDQMSSCAQFVCLLCSDVVFTDATEQSVYKTSLEKLVSSFDCFQYTNQIPGQDVMQSLVAMDLMIHAVAYRGVECSMFLELLSCEILFDCCSVMKTLFMSPSSDMTVLTQTLSVVQKVILLTHLLELDSNLLLDMCWMASAVFPWISLQTDWKELNKFKQSEQHVKCLEAIKQRLKESNNVRQVNALNRTATELICVLFQHLKVKHISAILIVNLKNCLQNDPGMQEVVLKNMLSISLTMMKADRKLFERFAIHTLLPVLLKHEILDIEPVIDIENAILLGTLPVEDVLMVNGSICRLTYCHSFESKREDKSISEQKRPKNCPLWQSFFVAVMNRMLSKSCQLGVLKLLPGLSEVFDAVDEMLNLLLTIYSESTDTETEQKALQVLEVILEKIVETKAAKPEVRSLPETCHVLLRFVKDTSSTVFHKKKLTLIKLSCEILVRGSDAEGGEEYFAVCMRSLIEYLFSTDSILNSFAKDALEQICCKNENFDLLKCFNDFKEDVGDVWAGVATLKYDQSRSEVNHNCVATGTTSKSSNEVKLNFVQQLIFICEVFKIKPSPKVIQDLSPLILPKLFMLNVSVAFIYCEEIGTNLLKEDVEAFMTQFIVPSVALLLSRGVEDPRIYFEQNFPSLVSNWSNLILPKLLQIVFSLVAYLAEQEKNVLANGIMYLAEIDFNFEDGSSGKKSVKSDPLNTCKKYLSYRLLAIMTNFKTVLLSNSSGKHAKVRRLKSCVKLMEYVGSEAVSLHDWKFLDIIRLIAKLKFDNCYDLMIAAYEKFVENLFPSNLQSLAPQIASDLISIPEEKATNVEALLGKLRSSFTDSLVASYYLPECCPSKTKEDLPAFVRDISEDSEIVRHLTVIVNGLKEEAIETKHFVLRNFLLFIKANPRVLSFFADSDSHEEGPLLTDTIRSLMLQFNVEDHEVNILTAQIIGHIGAIDPAKIVDLRVLSSKTALTLKLECTVESIEFKAKLINLLVQSQMASWNSDPRMIDCCAYSIQELLKVFDCSPASSSASGKRLWGVFDDETRVFLLPYLKSKYSYNCRVAPSANTESPRFYTDESIVSYKQWVCRLVKYLITNVSEARIFAVFQACDAVLNYNSDVATFLLPAVIIQLIVEKNETCKSLVIQEFLKALRDAYCANPRSYAKVCCQTIFVTLETITTYEMTTRSDTLWERATSVDSTNNKNSVFAKCDALTDFLKHIMSNTIAKGASACNAHARALFYIEDHLNSVSDPDVELTLMQKCFLELNEPDGVKGVNAIRKRKLNNLEKILNYKSQNKMNEALVCCATAIAKQPNSVPLMKEYLGCFLSIGQPDSAKYHGLGYMKEHEVSCAAIAPMCMEACWQLSDWSQLQNLQTNQRSNVELTNQTAGWQISFSDCIMTLSSTDWDALEDKLKTARSSQIVCIAAATMDYSNAYLRAYDAVAKLQMVSSVEFVSNFLQSPDFGNLNKIDDFCDSLSSRLKVLQPSFFVVESQRQLYRTLLSIMKENCGDGDLRQRLIDTRIQNSWLETSKAARAVDYFDTALKGLENSTKEGDICIENVLEQALLMQRKGNNYEGLMLLQKFLIDQNWNQVSVVSQLGNSRDKEMISKIYLQIGRFMEETRSVESNKIITIYKNGFEIWPEQEETYYYLGSYYEFLLETRGASADQKPNNILPKIHQLYLDALAHGNKFIFQALPRLLSIWLDQGAKLNNLAQEFSTVSSQSPGSSSENAPPERVSHLKNCVAYAAKNVQVMNQAMLTAVQDRRLAPYQLFTAFSQLISRICHPVDKVFDVIKKILVLLIQEYPQQALWLSVAVRNSSVKMRSERCAEIFEETKKQTPGFSKMLQASTALCAQLKELCEKNVNLSTPQDSFFSLRSQCNKLHKLLESGALSELIIPRMDSLAATIPESKLGNYQPFRNDKVYIHSFQDRIQVLISMQKPKKFVILGSDGNEYPMMGKPKDDLRKDYRVLECNVIMNQFLRRDPEARKRQLHIRTYAVIALDKENGLVEWIKNTQALRPICHRIYKERNKGFSPREIRSMQPPRQSEHDVFLNLYQKTLIPQYSPPVFREWFVRNFTDPTSWFLARLAYCRTAAVMSIVGYVWGLG